MSPRRELFNEEWQAEPFGVWKRLSVYEDGDGLCFFIDDGNNDSYGVEVTLSEASGIGLLFALEAWSKRA